MRLSGILVLFAVCLFLEPQALAIEAWIAGGQLGASGVQTGTGLPSFGGGIGFGVDLGLKNNPAVDVTLSIQRAADSGGVGLTSGLVTADLHILEYNDFEISFGAGPGLYMFGQTSGTQTNFGLQLGPNVDVIIHESIRIGIAAREHFLFTTAGVGGLWGFTMRVAYLFGSSP